jgi:hypothetical protein
MVAGTGDLIKERSGKEQPQQEGARESPRKGR